ncbi:DUF6668 family protein [Streptomyces capillispiralis]|uniref:DUF6668 family protein n=1 Tax=Streptomyces capillispiralis TaxID=68182 RepID=UPI0036AF0CBD
MERQSVVSAPSDGPAPAAPSAVGPSPVGPAPVGPAPVGPAGSRPAAPDGAEPAPLPSATRFPGAAVSWVGAHGGAGCTTLARLLGGADVGVRWPDPARGEPARMIVVARTHASGIQAASSVLDALRTTAYAPDAEAAAVVLVADAPGRLPVELARRVRVLGSVTTVHRVPWVPAWRLGTRTGQPPKEVLALADFIGPPA